MPEQEVQQLKNKIKELQNEILERTRNYILKHRSCTSKQNQSSTASQATQTDFVSEKVRANGSESRTQEDLQKVWEFPDVVLYSRRSRSEPDSQEKQYRLQAPFQGEDLQEIQNYKLLYNQLMEQYLLMKEQNIDMLEKQIELEESVQLFKRKYERESKKQTQHLEELEHILQETERIQNEFNKNKLALAETQLMLKMETGRRQQIERRYEGLRIQEYHWESQMKERKKLAEKQIRYHKNQNDMLKYELKITKAENVQIQLSYLRMKEQLQALKKNSHNRFNEFINQPIPNFLEISNIVFDIICRFPIRPSKNIFFRPKNEEELKEAFEALRGFSISYEEENDHQEKTVSKFLTKIALVFSTVNLNDLSKIQQIEGFSKISEVCEMIKQEGLDSIKVWRNYLQQILYY